MKLPSPPYLRAMGPKNLPSRFADTVIQWEDRSSEYSTTNEWRLGKEYFDILVQFESLAWRVHLHRFFSAKITIWLFVLLLDQVLTLGCHYLKLAVVFRVVFSVTSGQQACKCSKLKTLSQTMCSIQSTGGPSLSTMVVFEILVDPFPFPKIRCFVFAPKLGRYRRWDVPGPDGLCAMG